jgi:hypothetical protein
LHSNSKMRLHVIWMEHETYNKRATKPTFCAKLPGVQGEESSTLIAVFTRMQGTCNWPCEVPRTFQRGGRMYEIAAILVR